MNLIRGGAADAREGMRRMEGVAHAGKRAATPPVGSRKSPRRAAASDAAPAAVGSRHEIA